MDSFNVDMELLRRVGEIRKAVEKLDANDPTSTDAFKTAIASVRERVGDEATLEKLLNLMAWGVESASEEDHSPTSRLATGILAAAGAAEQAIFSDSGEEANALLNQAGSTLLLSLGEAPESWAGWNAGDSPDAPSSVDEKVESSPEAQGTEDVTLDDVAAFLVRMDPEDKADTLILKEMIEDFRDPENHPDTVVEIVESMIIALDAVTAPARTKKSVRREAVEEVGDLLEDASLILEEEEAPNIPLDDEEELADPVMADGTATDLQVEDSPEVKPVPESASEPEVEAAVEQDAEAPVMDIFPDSEPLPEGTDPDLTMDFVTEGFEYLEQAEEALLTLEGDPKDKEAVNVVFRAFHTIKGVSGFMELHRISDLAHHAETLLSKVRDNEVHYTGIVADLSLRGIDVLKALLDSVRQGVQNGILILTPDYGPLFTVLADPELPAKIEAGTVEGMDAADDMPEINPDENEAATEPEGEQEGGPAKRTRVTESSVRVRTDRLDRLVDMVGELVIAHSMLAQDPTILLDRGNLSRKVDHSAKILRELQDLSTSLRMVPLKPAFRKVTRVVRDLSKKIGKPVDLITDGEDTEIDRTMVDILADPLVHMVRNSLDHGLEVPEERAAAGKPKRGRVHISAFQAGGNVVIEVADDGRGLDREKILAKAIERGVVDSDRGMTDREIYNLIFAPGFSTAEKVTEVSGRGVGMDVVRRSVESLRGRVSIDSDPGKGSKFSIHLPLTLAITDGMVIRVGSQRYIIPSVKIQMSLRPEKEALSTVSGKGEMVLIQGDLLPVIRLHHLWGITDAIEDISNGLLVIVGEGATRSALLVDELVTQQQFVVKPLSGVVANTQGVAGGAIMGDGDVGLILDPEGIIAKARGLPHAAAA